MAAARQAANRCASVSTARKARGVAALRQVSRQDLGLLQQTKGRAAGAGEARSNIAVYCMDLAAPGAHDADVRAALPNLQL